ncbi:MAG: thiamine-phosphate kinase, partial [Proteobacteria bacterium]|nr:thiamine-phosphate kinase [Pseudomonadota bacterium]
DIAAMGAKPKFALLGISAPSNQLTYVQEFIHYFTKYCKKFNTYIIGGDTTESKYGIFASITLIGEVKKEHLKLRNQAKKGDIICVAGKLGFAHLGFCAFEKNLNKFSKFKHHFLFPNAKIQEGQFLGSISYITSMMDISDGLYIDLNRLILASCIGASINLDLLPASANQFMRACYDLKLNPINVMLTGGEDYGLLFTIQKEKYIDFCKIFRAKFAYEILKIGEINAESKISFIQNDQRINLDITPFKHFSNPHTT